MAEKIAALVLEEQGFGEKRKHNKQKAKVSSSDSSK